MTDEANVQRDLTRLVIGIAVIVAGILWTLDNLHLIHAERFLSYWPIVLVAIGAIKIVQSDSWVAYGWSLVWIVAGLWLLGEKVGLISVSIWQLWPLVLVMVGASIIWRACRPPQLHGDPAPLSCCPPQLPREPVPLSREILVGEPVPTGGARSPRDSYVRAVAVMGGLERASDSSDFRGADLLAIMGGCELDLRRATIAGDEAVIDVVAFMGGIEIYVPENWTIVAKVLPLMGGLGDETRLNKTLPTKRLVIRGLALMGGVEVKN